ncbi:MAG: MspA family porin [Gordonia sp. (in: high G+C Gram-positive bacteria)]|uniref:MspA family porin n=1 Tax=Gordonia sp. (in: high G+C Gram-positive bacteria) TaxID=84139 RepID=UPI0039E4471A
MQKNQQRVARLVTAVAVAGVAAAAVTGAGAAEAASLKSVSKSKAIPGGSVAIKLFDEKYSVQQAVTNVPTSREVFVSGKVRVTTGGDVEGGAVTPGYVVGCQLNFGASGSGTAGVTTSSDDQSVITVPVGGGSLDVPLASDTGVGSGFTLAPGDAKFVPVIKASIGGNTVNSFTFTDHQGGVAYSQERFGVDGCAGFAEARAVVNVQVSTDDYKGNITLYGRPFSIG